MGASKKERLHGPVVRAINSNIKEGKAFTKSGLGEVGNKGNLEKGVQKGFRQKAVSKIKAIGKEGTDTQIRMKKRFIKSGSILDKFGNT